MIFFGIWKRGYMKNFLDMEMGLLWDICLRGRRIRSERIRVGEAVGYLEEKGGVLEARDLTVRGK